MKDGGGEKVIRSTDQSRIQDRRGPMVERERSNIRLMRSGMMPTGGKVTQTGPLMTGPGTGTTFKAGSLNPNLASGMVPSGPMGPAGGQRGVRGGGPAPRTPSETAPIRMRSSGVPAKGVRGV